MTMLKDLQKAINRLEQDKNYSKKMQDDLVTWQKVEHLIRIRNLCDHDNEREPTKDEVAELINGVSAMLKKL